MNDLFEASGSSIGADTKASVYALADSMGILLSALYQSDTLTGPQVSWTVKKIHEVGEAAENEISQVRRMEGVMLRVIAKQLRDAIEGIDT